ncbi:MAG: RidA family protein [bacterium]
MKKEIIHTDNAPAAIGPYSQAVKANGFLFLSGQIPLDAKTGEIVGDSIETQTGQVLKNIREILSQEGLDSSDIVTCKVYLTALDLFSRFNEVYGRNFPQAPPARVTVEVSALPKGSLIEIEATAVY